MSKRKTAKKKTRRRKRQSKAEHFFGAVVIEGLGVLAVIVMFMYARRASEPQTPAMAGVNSQQEVQFDSAINQSEHQLNFEWREPSSSRFDQRYNQASYFPSSR